MQQIEKKIFATFIIYGVALVLFGLFLAFHCHVSIFGYVIFVLEPYTARSLPKTL